MNTRLLLIVLGVLIIGILLSSFYSAHYSSPATGIVLALTVSAIRRVSQWRPREQPRGVFLTRAFLVIAFLSFTLRAFAGPLHIPLSQFYEFAWYQNGAGGFGREAIERQLRKMPGNQLVIVKYAPFHEPFAEWVYNDADIDHSKVVWARAISPDQDRALLDYFKDRRVWLLDADNIPPTLSAYTAKEGIVP